MKRILFVLLFSFAFVARADLTQEQMTAAVLQALKDYSEYSTGWDFLTYTVPLTDSDGGDFLATLLTYTTEPGDYQTSVGHVLYELASDLRQFWLPYIRKIGANSNDLVHVVSNLQAIVDGYGYRNADTLHSQLDSIEYYAQGLWGHVPAMETRLDEHGSELLVAAPDLESALGDLQYTFSQSSIIASDTSQSLQGDVVPLLRLLVSNMVPTTLQIRDAEDITNALPYDLAEDHETDFEDEYQSSQDDLDSTAPDWSDKFTDNPWDYGGNITNRLLNGMLDLVDDVDPVTSPELIIMGSYDTPSALSGAARLPRIAVNLEDSLRRSNALRFATTVMSALWLIVGVFYKFSALQKFVDWYTKKSKGF